MARAEPRSARQRKEDTLAKLATPGIDVWVASASSGDGGAARAHLVPLSMAWVDGRVVIALEAASRTARNLVEQCAARLALGPTRDVVVIDAVVDRVVDVGGAPADLVERYVAQADWDPRAESGRYVFVVLAPERIQAWREADELAGRTLMRAGCWLA